MVVSTDEERDSLSLYMGRMYENVIKSKCQDSRRRQILCLHTVYYTSEGATLDLL
jgi:hypothetical protein